MMKDAALTAAEATAELGITRQTLYAYVSRGLIRSQEEDRGKRTRKYDAEDVRKLKERREIRLDPAKAVDSALDWGIPLRDSALTLIDGGRCYYRGRDSLDLARSLTVEQVAAWIWLGDVDQADSLFSEPAPEMPEGWNALSIPLSRLAPSERFQSALPLLGAEDLAAYDFRPRHVADTGARILQLMTGLALTPSKCTGAGIAESLQQNWLPSMPEAAPLLRAALILCADHELNVSSFTARCVASAGASPYAVVCGGLAALQGVKHGGNCARVEALFHEAGTPQHVRKALMQRVRRGDAVPGFGHPLYPNGDPRGRLLIEMATAACLEAPGVRLAAALVEEARAMLHEEPNLDFGLCTLCCALDLPPGTPLTLFALGRTIGWIGHAIEEYQADVLIRPRARYTGVSPNPVEEPE